MARIAVVGSLNLDVVMMVATLPSPGETVLARRHFTNPGGKGANQAVAAARLGNEVSMVGAVGNDSEGRRLIEALNADGVNTSHVVQLDAPTGMAAIAVDANAENTIAVGPGANGAITVSHLERAAAIVATADVVLMQLEIPLDVVEAAASVARGLVILNPAPALDLPQSLLDRVDVLVPNQHELRVLASDDAPIENLVAKLVGPKDVVVTLGSRGAFIGSVGVTVPVLEVEPVDTTAAGDSFCGALADGLGRGGSITEAVNWAAAAAAVTVTRLGAQQSLPTRREVQAIVDR